MTKNLKFDKNLLAVTATLMASKFQEIDDNLIMASEMLTYIEKYSRSTSSDQIPYQDLTRGELQALTRFEWDCFRVQAIDFIEIYFQVCIQ